jgi:large subunit ribosomal protein L13e
MHHIKPTITKQNGKQSQGKGFSPNELKEAGLDKVQARRIGLSVDTKRKSKHDENIQTLKEHAEKAKTQAETKPKPSKPKEKKKAKSKSS